MRSTKEVRLYQVWKLYENRTLEYVEHSGEPQTIILETYAVINLQTKKVHSCWKDFIDASNTAIDLNRIAS